MARQCDNNSKDKDRSYCMAYRFYYHVYLQGKLLFDFY